MIRDLLNILFGTPDDEDKQRADEVFGKVTEEIHNMGQILKMENLILQGKLPDQENKEKTDNA